MRTAEQVWDSFAGMLDAMGEWSMVRYAKIGACTFLAGAASGPFVAPDEAALVGVGAMFAAAVACRAADLRAARNSPEAKAAAVAAKLQAVATEYAASNARKRAEIDRKKAKNQAAAYEWERAALQADGGQFERPAPQQGFGQYQPAGGHTGLDWPPYPVKPLHLNGQGGRLVRVVIGADGERAEFRTLQSFSQGGATAAPTRPTCWCMVYGWNAKRGVAEEHYFDAHTKG